MGRNGTGDTEQKSILENYTSWKYFRYCCLSPHLVPSPFPPSPLTPFTPPPGDIVFLSGTNGFVLLTFNLVTDTSGCVAFMSKASMEKTVCIGKPRHSFVLV